MALLKPMYEEFDKTSISKLCARIAKSKSDDSHKAI